jgi:hypothetical protein
MTCWRCAERLSERLVSFCHCSAVRPIIVENVPALISEECGERTYPDSSVDVLERIRDGQGGDPHLRYLYAYDFTVSGREAKLKRMSDSLSSQEVASGGISSGQSAVRSTL